VTSIEGGEHTQRSERALKNFRERFLSAINNDLNMPQALSVVWDAVKTGENNPELQTKVYELLIDFDRVLGFGLADIESAKIPRKVKELVEKREELRAEEQWKEADELRETIKELGFEIEDTPQGPLVFKL